MTRRDHWISDVKRKHQAAKNAQKPRLELDREARGKLVAFKCLGMQDRVFLVLRKLSHDKFSAHV